MEIKDIQGNILFDAPVTQSAVLTEELMKQYGITLGWNAVTADVLPVGAYIEHNGVRYSLLEPYSPTQKDEATYEYSPVFHHPVMRWGKLPMFLYSGATQELDWSLTDNPANFMSAVCQAITNQTGEVWSFEVASDLPSSASLSFSNTDIFSALNSIADAFKTEWWFDYANKVVYLSKAGHGSAVTLEVGQNVGVPQVTQNKEGYYTRFYGFGSTRNIDQSYAGANVNSIVNRRLTLDPAKYPNGYIDIREGLTQEEVLSVPLVFDDIYPRSSLTISDVKVRLMWRLDDNSQKVQIGTDSEGNPVYDQYAIWYFKIPGFAFSKDLLISGKSLSVHFNSGSLNGREFELTYHDKSETLSNSDGTDFVVEAGDYEINFVEEGSYIIPAVTGLIPAEGDAVTLFNIIMPEEYKASAYTELEEAVRERMAQQEEDRNNYSFESNKVAFYESNPNLSIGRLVTFVNGSKSISTRVIKLETQLDYPFEQRITVGNAIIKGGQQTLKEEVVNANQNIDLLAAINESSEAFQQSLQRTQKAVLESIAKMPDLGLSLVEQDGKTWLRSEHDFYSEGEVSSGGASDTEGEGGSGGSVVTVEQIVTDANGVPIAKINVDGVPNVIYAPRTADVDLSGYATTDYVNTAIQNAKDTRVDTLINTTIPALESDIAKRALQSDLTALQTSHNALRNDFDALNTLLNDDVSEKIDTWNEVVDFLDEYSGSQDLATILSVMNADIAKRALQTSLDATNANLNNHIDTFNTFVDATNNTLLSHNNRIKTLEDMFEWDGENIKAKASFYSVGEVSSGGLSDTGGSTGGNTVSWVGAYESGNLLGTLYIDGVANTILGPLTLPNPYALTINGEVYDGSKAVDITISGGTADSVAWDAITGKPTTLFDWHGYLWNSNTSAYDLYQNGVYSYAGGVTGNNWPSGYGVLANLGSGNNANKMQLFESLYGVLLHRVKFDSDSCDWRVILDSANCGNYALPIIGGTINSTTATPLIVNTTNSTSAYIRIDINNSGKAAFGWNSTNGAFIYNWQGGDYLRVGDDHHPYFNDKVLLHSGNYSSHALPLSGGTINGTLNIYDTVNRSIIKIVSQTNQPNDLWFGANGTEHWSLTSRDSAENYLFALYAHINDGGVGAYVYTANLQTGVVDFKYQPTVNGNAIIHSGNIGSQSVNYANRTERAVTLDSYSMDKANTRSSHYSFALTTGAWNSNTYGYASTYGQYLDISGFSTWYNRLAFNTTGQIEYFQGINTTTLSKIGDIAFIHSNVASATKLANARTIWGQPFDGTSNVDGVITTMQVTNGSVPVIKFSNGEHFDNWGNFCFGENSNTWSVRNSTSLTTQVYLQVVRTTGNVLIGTTTESGYKLYVKGAGRFDGPLRAQFNNTGVSIEPSIGGTGNTGISFYNDRWFAGHIEGETININTLYKGQTNIGGGLSVKGGVDYCFTVGVGSDNRSHLELVTQSYNPCDLVLGADYDIYWSITARNSADAQSRALCFYSYKNSAYRMSILDNGNILIGTTTDNGYNTLQVNGSGYFKSSNANGPLEVVDNYSTTSGWHRCLTALSPNLQANENFSIYLGKANSSYNGAAITYQHIADGSRSNKMWFGFHSADYLVTIDTYGNLVATGEVTSGSDARYKRIESYAEIDINTIANAPIINFRWTDREDDKLHLGSTAQYWYNTSLLNGVFPTDDEKLWTMGYGQIALASVVSVAKKVVNHEERLQIVEKELADYKAENQELKQLLNQYRYGIQ